MTKLAVIEKDKEERIVAELEGAGVFHPSRHPFTSNYLPRAIHDDEHIMAAVFGRKKESEGFFGFVEGILVATNLRVLFLDRRMGYTSMDEISYDVVSGVNISSTLIYASVTLFTKVANYKLSFTNHTAAQKFADYVESRVLEHNKTQPQESTERPSYEVSLKDDDMRFFLEHDIGVLSTVERTGALNGSVVYYTVRDGYLYFMTKENSHKVENILGNQHVSFVVFDEAKLQTAQLQGIVEQVTDDNVKLEVLTMLMKPRTYADGSHKPPILRMSNAGILTYRITPTKYNLTDYSNL